MASRVEIDGVKQSKSMLSLQEIGYISDLKEEKGRSLYTWRFRMGKLTFFHSDDETNVDFSKYHLRIVYRPSKEPKKRVKVFIEKPLLTKRKHMWNDNSLCLYKHDNFRWKKGMTIKKDLFASICTWIYHYEKWRETDKWHGEEAQH